MKKPSGSSGRKDLDADEQQLWDLTARSIDPLKRTKSRVHKGHAEPQASPPPRSKKNSAAAPTAKSKTPPSTGLTPAPSKQTVPPMAAFDRKAAKKLRAGRVEIEARIDLHGMRQHEAHDALIAFLRRAHSKGQRWVLVITGKGSGQLNEDETAPFDMTSERGRGVLKRNVPRWLEEPGARAMVVSFTAAALAHGGDGALYVQLRKRSL